MINRKSLNIIAALVLGFGSFNASAEPVYACGADCNSLSYKARLIANSSGSKKLVLTISFATIADIIGGVNFHTACQ